MTYWITFVALICSMSLSPIQAQSSALQPVTQALQAGNAKIVASYFDVNVEITLPTEEGVYSKAQAEQMVKDFFLKTRPSGFRLMHEGDSGGNAIFGIGELETAQGDFRTYIYMKRLSSSGFVIQKLKFTND